MTRPSVERTAEKEYRDDSIHPIIQVYMNDLCSRPRQARPDTVLTGFGICLCDEILLLEGDAVRPRVLRGFRLRRGLGLRVEVRGRWGMLPELEQASEVRAHGSSGFDIQGRPRETAMARGRST